MIMHIVCLIAVLLTVGSCKPRTATNSESSPETNEVTKEPGPSSQDLLEALRGRWQNEQDTASYIQFTDDLITYYSGRTNPEEKRIEVAFDCRNAVCGSDSLANTVGWCFLEKNAADTQCYIVLRCDSLALRFQALDGSDEIRSFKKI